MIHTWAYGDFPQTVISLDILDAELVFRPLVLPRPAQPAASTVISVIRQEQRAPLSRIDILGTWTTATKSNIS